MTQVIMTTDKAGYITNYYPSRDGVEVDDELLTKVIIGVTKLVGDTLTYRVHLELDDAGYITSYGTDPAGEISFTQTQQDMIVLGATKLIDGNPVVDQERLAALAALEAKPVPTAEQQVLAAMMAKIAALEARANDGL